MNITLLKQLFFPQGNSCCLCGRWGDTEKPVCSSCMRKVKKSCLQDEAVLLRDHPPLTLSLAAWKYEGPVRRLIHQMKYGGNGEIAALLGTEMAGIMIRKHHQSGSVDLVIPVPLHPLRERKRGYNQALLMAGHVCCETGLPLRTDVLTRVRHTSSQVRRTRKERIAAMRNAFCVPDASLVSGKRILVVDDVLTTGATAIACACALLDAGAKEVMVLTAARAVQKAKTSFPQALHP